MVVSDTIPSEQVKSIIRNVVADERKLNCGVGLAFTAREGSSAAQQGHWILFVSSERRQYSSCLRDQMSLIIKNISLLLGNDLKFINRGRIVIRKDGLIRHAGQGHLRIQTSGTRSLTERDSWHVRDLLMPTRISVIQLERTSGIDLDFKYQRIVHPHMG